MKNVPENKQQVNYRAYDEELITVGQCAYVYALNHPRLGETHVRTSIVQSHDLETGTFETLNTIYTPESHIKPAQPKPGICHKHG